MEIAYLVNHYPQPSQTFIRREIAALEALGPRVHRFATRPCRADLVDAEDRAELGRTRALLGVGPLGLLAASVGTAMTRPGRFARALALAWRLGRRSDRGRLVNLVYLAEACVLRRWLAERGVGHLHAHFGTNPAAVALLCRRLGGPPYSFTAHGTAETDRPWSLALDEKIRHAAFAVAVSEYGRSQLYRWSDPADWPKLHVVRCGLDPAFLAAPRVPTPAAPRLVCVGRLAAEKGHLVLIEAIARLRDRGLDAELVLVGDGPMRPRIERRSAELRLGERVRLVGWRDGPGVQRAIREARALVLPSFAEGLPVVLMEALALGRPVVSTGVAGIPELVRAGREGWLVPPGSVEALAEALAEVLGADPAELDRMGRRGAERVAGRHDARIEAGELIRLIAAHHGRGLPGAATADTDPVGGEWAGVGRPPDHVAVLNPENFRGAPPPSPSF